MSRALLLCCLTVAAGFAQSPEIAHLCDGAAGEKLSAEGDATWIADAGRSSVGKSLYRVAPKDGARFYGPAVEDVPTRGRPSIVCVVHLEGDQPRDFRFKLDDAASGRAQNDALVEYRTLRPGKNEVAFPLTDRKTAGGRALDFSQSVRRLQISKRADAGDPAILLDGVLYAAASGVPSPPESRPAAGEGARKASGGATPPAAGAPTPAEKAAQKKLLAALAAEKDGEKRAKLLRDPGGLDSLGEVLRVETALRIAKEDGAPRVRRACREAFARTSTPEAAEALLAGIAKAKSPLLAELWWAAAASPSVELRAAATARALAPKTPVGERTAIVTGFGKRGSAEARSLAAACPPEGPWPPRAALVRALRVGAVPESVDGLIEILAAPGSERVALDTEEALISLTGQDLGRNAPAWKAWWDVQRDKVKVADSGRRTAGGYGTFYGVSVPKGRLAFVLDTSGSMREEATGATLEEYLAKAKHLVRDQIKTRLDLAKAELIHATSGLKDCAFVGVVSFGTDRTWMTDGLERADEVLRERLKKRIGALAPGGTTNVWAGLRSAFHPGKEPSDRDWQDGPDTIFLLSDGNPSSGLFADREELRDEVLAWNLSRAIKIHCVNVGDADVQMLRAWTQSSGGVLLDLRSERVAPPPAK
jgi:hypothetical protein